MFLPALADHRCKCPGARRRVSEAPRSASCCVCLRWSPASLPACTSLSRLGFSSPRAILSLEEFYSEDLLDASVLSHRQMLKPFEAQQQANSTARYAYLLCPPTSKLFAPLLFRQLAGTRRKQHGQSKQNKPNIHTRSCAVQERCACPTFHSTLADCLGLSHTF